MKDSDLVKIIQEYSYLGIFIWFAFVQMIAPLPEEIALTSIGYLSRHIGLNIFICILISTIGLTVSNYIDYGLAKSGSLISKKIMGGFSNKWINKLQHKLEKNYIGTMFFLLLIPKVRVIASIISATGGFSFKLFSIINILSSFILSLVFTFIGAIWYKSFDSFKRELHEHRHWVFIFLMIVGTAIIIYYTRKHFYEKKHS